MEEPLTVYQGPDPARVKQHIVDKVQSLVQADDAVDGDTPLMESGLDSIVSVELRTQLQNDFQVQLPSAPQSRSRPERCRDSGQRKQVTWRRSAYRSNDLPIETYYNDQTCFYKYTCLVRLITPLGDRLLAGAFPDWLPDWDSACLGPGSRRRVANEASGRHRSTGGVA